MLGEIVRLIEPSVQRTPGVQRDGHDCVGVRQDLGSRLREETGEGHREHPPTLVLERVNDLTQRPVVPARASRRPQHRWLTPAAWTERLHRSPGRVRATKDGASP